MVAHACACVSCPYKLAHGHGLASGCPTCRGTHRPDQHEPDWALAIKRGHSPPMLPPQQTQTWHRLGVWPSPWTTDLAFGQACRHRPPRTQAPTGFHSLNFLATCGQGTQVVPLLETGCSQCSNNWHCCVVGDPNWGCLWANSPNKTEILRGS